MSQSVVFKTNACLIQSAEKKVWEQVTIIDSGFAFYRFRK